MGFPFKKRVDTSVCIETRTKPNGLHLLSAAIDSHSQHVPVPIPIHKGRQDLVIQSSGDTLIPSSSTGVARKVSNVSSSEDCSSVDPTRETTPKVNKVVCHSSDSTQKRTKTFPEILMDVLSNPDYTPIISWLPNGISFAIHDSSQFSAQILPKYFRARVIFRSFARKLNRWGFRSVKRSVSGFEYTYEHKFFRRDQPELCAKMCCKSKAMATRNLTCNDRRVGPTNARTVFASPRSTSSDDPTILLAPQAAQMSLPFTNGNFTPVNISGIYQNQSDFLVQLANELLVKHMQHQQMKRLSPMQLIHQQPDVKDGAVP